MVKLQARVV